MHGIRAAFQGDWKVHLGYHKQDGSSKRHCWREYTWGPVEVEFKTALELDVDVELGTDAEAEMMLPP